MNQFLINKEIKENIFATKGILWLFVSSLMLSGLSLGFISIKELSLMAQNEILVTVGKVILGIALLITIILGSVSISNEREQATLESLLLTPNSASSIAFGKLIGILFIWLLVFVTSIPYIYVLSYGTGLFLSTSVLIGILGSVLVIIFSGISIAYSIFLKSSKNAIIVSILTLLITSIPIFLSTTMKKAGFGKLIDSVSPVSNVMNLLKEVIVKRADFISLIHYFIPLVIYVVAAILFLKFAVSKLNFEGGE